jgi:hypothetical protein
MMTLSMPDGQVLQLGRDLASDFPPLLRVVDLPELAALLALVDPTPDSTLDTGAQDWGRLPDRMHFIADLFRAWHIDPSLFDPPFSPDQVADLLAGRLPIDPL